MKLLLEEYGDMVYLSIISCLLIAFIISVLSNNIVPTNLNVIEESNTKQMLIEESIPTSIENFIVKEGFVEQGKTFDYSDRVSATNSKGEDISSYIRPLNSIDTSSVGTKNITYILRYNGESMIGKTRVYVKGESV